MGLLWAFSGEALGNRWEGRLPSHIMLALHDSRGIYGRRLSIGRTVVGDVYTPRIAIEDGTSLEGTVHVHKDIPRPQTKKTPQREVA
jgi:hypothetical protein